LPECNRILVIDDHPLFRDALRVAVGKSFPQAQFAEGRNIEEAIEALDKHDAFDLALLDLKIPGVQGFDGLLRLRKLYPCLPVLVISGLEDNRVISKVLSFGAAGFVPKSIGRESLGAAARTIKAHVSEILRKLDVNSRTQAVIEASIIDDSRFSQEETI